MDDSRLDDSEQSQPLRNLSQATLDRLGYFLDRKKILKTEDDGLRDWRGLLDLAKLSLEQKERVKSAPEDNKTCK